MITSEDVRDDWNRAAPAWIAQARAQGDLHRVGLLDPWMLDACGDVAGRDVIDLGCGEGRFSLMLAERGARVLGVDYSDVMIAAANQRPAHDVRYAVGDMAALTKVDNDAFDLAVSYVSLIDVVDHRRAIAEAFRVLKPGGRFVVANLAPMVTAGNRWIKTPEGVKTSFYLDNYLDETPRLMPLNGVNIRNFHRTLSNYVEAYLAAGFVIAGLREPFPSAEHASTYPQIADNLRVPLFQIFLLDKPT